MRIRKFVSVLDGHLTLGFNPSPKKFHCNVFDSATFLEEISLLCTEGNEMR